MIDELVAVLPAAGLSRRMGQPKLLLPLGGRPVISRVIETLKLAGITRAVVTVRSGDQPLIDAVKSSGGIVIAPTPPPSDMRRSVEAGLIHLLEQVDDSAWRGWILIPADHPTLRAEVIRELVSAWQSAPDRIIVPVHQGRRGHPTILPRRLANEVFSLPDRVGINQLIRDSGQSIHEVPTSYPEVLEDLDTPSDWDRISARWRERDIHHPS